MNSDTTLSIPALSGLVFDALPESIRSYIRFLEATIQKQQKLSERFLAERNSARVIAE